MCLTSRSVTRIAPGPVSAGEPAAAETDVLGGIRTGHVEDVRLGEDAGIAVGRAEQHRDHLAARDRHTGDLDAVLEHPALEELEWGVVADQLFDGGGCRHFAGDETPPLPG